jgi:hypothetical protein
VGDMAGSHDVTEGSHALARLTLDRMLGGLETLSGNVSEEKYSCPVNTHCPLDRMLRRLQTLSGHVSEEKYSCPVTPTDIWMECWAVSRPCLVTLVKRNTPASAGN